MTDATVESTPIPGLLVLRLSWNPVPAAAQQAIYRLRPGVLR